MPDFLIITEDRSPHEKGDAIFFQPNDAEWGTKELDLDIFRIVSIPDADMDAVEAESWITAQIGYHTRNELGGNPLLKRRAKTFDFVHSSLTGTERADLAKPRVMSVRANDIDGNPHNTRSELPDARISASNFRSASSIKPILI